MKKQLTLLIICLTTLFVYQTMAQVFDDSGSSNDSTEVQITTEAYPLDEADHNVRTEHAGSESAPAEESEQDNEDFASILISLIIILLAAKLGGDLCERVNQPAVLGELIFGVILGNLYLLGFGGFEHIKHHITIEIFAEIGVIILLFEVGLESNIKEMMSVGLVSFLVAILGVVTPFLLGWGVSAMFMPDESIYVHVFIGATLTATSVGITARVLQDIGRLRYRESKIILGAAVIDDVLGLVILSICTGIIAAANAGGSGTSSGMVLFIVAKAFVFIFGSIAIGTFLAPRLFDFVAKMRGSGLLITFSLMFCFLFAYIAKLVGLAPIVGAFAAGLILEDVYYKDLTKKGETQLDELLKPIAAFLVPIFFVHMGMKVDLISFGNISILGFALVLTIAAIIGKQVCSLGTLTEKGLNRWVVGIGMIPRGEVGLIFAGIGSKMILDGKPVVDTNTLSAVVIMVILTTLVTPPVLKVVFKK
ncbi:MAG: cation:proton antiporter [candidate division Zixibacteria bacterium]|nr:cation:proton antiporter [candidate division Zixibacteria bacterium]